LLKEKEKELERLRVLIDQTREEGSNYGR